MREEFTVYTISPSVKVRLCIQYSEMAGTPPKRSSRRAKRCAAMEGIGSWRREWRSRSKFSLDKADSHVKNRLYFFPAFGAARTRMNNISLEDSRWQRLSKVPFRSLPAEAARQVREGILRGTIKPGERLVEQKLAAELGIGQPTVREALKELEHHGFVFKVPHKGTYVTRLDPQDAAMILEVRLTVEVLAIRRAMRNMTKADVRELEEILDAMELAAQTSDLASFHQNDLAFHRKIWDLSGNRYIAIALERLAFTLFAYGIMPPQNQTKARRPLADVETHRQILVGLRSGDSELACATFVEGISKNWKDYSNVEIDRSLIPTISVNPRPAAKSARRKRS
jgi:DNA-binding GntR family transcriptional regulator